MVLPSVWLLSKEHLNLRTSAHSHRPALNKESFLFLSISHTLLSPMSIYRHFSNHCERLAFRLIGCTRSAKNKGENAKGKRESQCRAFLSSALYHEIEGKRPNVLGMEIIALSLHFAKRFVPYGAECIISICDIMFICMFKPEFIENSSMRRRS